ncbi:hypothetical protein K4L44_12745 [Halosquirtibacter laminarini]|uniref:Uncharacterized protein n=1 Tax=Halosquirtibacter laminarini TaxID=3374600 RepID=A0AC61ND38_9BACT|nr:hypothetical protein K4L44_12745 [Prolixibacteraceae bacterium]
MNKEQTKKHLHFVREDIDHVKFLLDNLEINDEISPIHLQSVVDKCESIASSIKLLLPISQNSPLEESKQKELEQIREKILKEFENKRSKGQKEDQKDKLHQKLQRKQEEKLREELRCEIERKEEEERREELRREIERKQEEERREELRREIERKEEEERREEENKRNVQHPQVYVKPEPSTIDKKNTPDNTGKQTILVNLKRTYNSIQLEPTKIPLLGPIEERAITPNINDNIMFCREIFNEDTSLYKNILGKLNTTESEDEALEFLLEAPNLQDSTTLLAFLEEIKCKFYK